MHQGPPGQPPSGGPPYGGGAPPQGGGYGGPPQQQPQGYPQPQQHGGYPPAPQGYGQQYGQPPHAQGGGYPPHPAQQPGYPSHPAQPPGYGAPPGPPPGYGGYPQAPASYGHGAPPGPASYGAPGPHGYGAPHGMHGYGAPSNRAPKVRINGGLFLALYLISLIGIVGLAAIAGNPATQEAAMALPIPVLVSSITMMVFLYKMWSAINDGVTRPSPGAAVGCLFIPLFSLYWIFIVWPGYATAYNAYAQRHGIQVQPLSMGFILCTILLGWIPIVGLILMCMTISRISNAVNALSDSNLPTARAM